MNFSMDFRDFDNSLSAGFKVDSVKSNLDFFRLAAKASNRLLTSLASWFKLLCSFSEKPLFFVSKTQRDPITLFSTIMGTPR